MEKLKKEFVVGLLEAALVAELQNPKEYATMSRSIMNAIHT